MDEAPNPHLRRALLEVVDNQLRDNDPPETKETLQRLMKTGLSRKQAIELIACVVASEIFEVLNSKRPYDNVRFVAALQALPRLPWEDDE
jgi:uncharacterized protein YoaH (UPF0181 family)